MWMLSSQPPKPSPCPPPQAGEGLRVAARSLVARYYTQFLTIVERTASGERRTHEEWQSWVQQIMGVLPH